MKIVRTVEVDRPVSAVFAYLSDFTTTNDWDPGTVKTTLASGDGGVGTTYHNVSSFMGRETELTYEVIELEPDAVFALRGENKTLVAHDTMTFEATPTGGTRMTYSADFAFKGITAFLAPLLAPAFKKLGDQAEQGLREKLGAL